MASQSVKIVEGGKVVIPARFRRELGFEVGDTVIVEVSKGALQIRPRKAAISQAQKLMRQLVAKGHSLADELIADRRADAARDE